MGGARAGAENVTMTTSEVRPRREPLFWRRVIRSLFVRGYECYECGRRPRWSWQRVQDEWQFLSAPEPEPDPFVEIYGGLLIQQVRPFNVLGGQVTAGPGSGNFRFEFPSQ